MRPPACARGDSARPPTATGTAAARRERRRRGVTLVEMLIAMVLVAMLTVAAAQLLSVLLSAQTTVAAEAGLDPEAERALQAMADAVRQTTTLALPNGRCRSTERLALSANIDNDGDGRIDEDPGAVLWGTGPGVRTVDDDGDGMVDESMSDDDDEDGRSNEDWRDGIDNDSDGSIDEDSGADANADGAPGARRLDDDGDGSVDEGSGEDDDEDGKINEDGPDLMQIYFVPAERRLYEERPGAAAFVLLTDVDDFAARYLTGAAGEPLLELRLDVRPAGSPDALQLSTRVYPANLVGKHGFTTP